MGKKLKYQTFLLVWHNAKMMADVTTFPSIHLIIAMVILIATPHSDPYLTISAAKRNVKRIFLLYPRIDAST